MARVHLVQTLACGTCVLSPIGEHGPVMLQVFGRCGAVAGYFRFTLFVFFFFPLTSLSERSTILINSLIAEASPNYPHLFPGLRSAL